MSAVAHIRQYKAGKFYSDDFRDGISWNGYENNVLLRNEGTAEDGTPRFTDVAMALGADDIRDSRGSAAADFDQDGDLDLIVNHNPGDRDREIGVPPALLRNDLGQDRAWLAVELEGTTSNRDGVGAQVTAVVGPLRQLRLAAAGSGYASQDSGRLYFGLADAERVDELIVRWPGGATERFEDLPVRRLVKVTEGSGIEVRPLPGAVDSEQVPEMQLADAAEADRTQ